MFFLYHRTTSLTGKVLGRALGGRWGTDRYRRGTEDVLIRWGCVDGSDAPTTINKREAIVLASDKLRSLEVMQEAGVPVISFSRSASDLEGTIFGRSRHHTRGSDIRTYDRDALMLHVIPYHDFYTEYIVPRHEYRIHVVNGEVIRSQIKSPESEGGRSEMSLIRNRSNGWILNGMNTVQPNRDRLDAAIAAVEALGLDFGAVDLIVGRTDNQPYVLEVNTAPRCDERTGRAYVEALTSLCESRGGSCRPHLDVLDRLQERTD